MLFSNQSRIDELTSALGISIGEQLEVALDAEDISLLQDFLCWKRTSLLSLGYSENEIRELFNNLESTYSIGMDPKIGGKVESFIKEAIKFLDCSKAKPEITENNLSALASKYQQLLLEGNRQEASRIILEAANSGISVHGIYTRVFQSSLYSIGKLWQTNRITIAQEHYFTAATQMIMSQLYSYIFSNNKNGYQLVAASVDSNMHDIGIRMVADFFEMAGWDTYYLGGNTPIEVIIQAIHEKRPHLLALSVAIAPQVKVIKGMIEEIRQEKEFDSLKIIVGGPPFNIVKDLWKKVGSDGFAHSADEAVEVANKLFKINGNL